MPQGKLFRVCPHAFPVTQTLSVPKIAHRTFPNDRSILDICCKKPPSVSLEQRLLLVGKWKLMPMVGLNCSSSLWLTSAIDLCCQRRAVKRPGITQRFFSYLPASQLPNHGEGLNGSEQDSNGTEGHLGHIAHSFFTARKPA